RSGPKLGQSYPPQRQARAISAVPCALGAGRYSGGSGNGSYTGFVGSGQIFTSASPTQRRIDPSAGAALAMTPAFAFGGSVLAASGGRPFAPSFALPPGRASTTPPVPPLPSVTSAPPPRGLTVSTRSGASVSHEYRCATSAWPRSVMIGRPVSSAISMIRAAASPVASVSPSAVPRP